MLKPGVILINIFNWSDHFEPTYIMVHVYDKHLGKFVKLKLQNNQDIMKNSRL